MCNHLLANDWHQSSLCSFATCNNILRIQSHVKPRVTKNRNIGAQSPNPPRIYHQDTQKEPLNRMPSTAAKATKRSAKEADRFIHCTAQRALSRTAGIVWIASKSWSFSTGSLMYCSWVDGECFGERKRLTTVPVTSLGEYQIWGTDFVRWWLLLLLLWWWWWSSSWSWRSPKSSVFLNPSKSCQNKKNAGLDFNATAQSTRSRFPEGQGEFCAVATAVSPLQGSGIICCSKVTCSFWKFRTTKISISPAYDPNSKDTSNSHFFCFGTHWKTENVHQYSSPS